MYPQCSFGKKLLQFIRKIEWFNIRIFFRDELLQCFWVMYCLVEQNSLYKIMYVKISVAFAIWIKQTWKKIHSTAFLHFCITPFYIAICILFLSLLAPETPLNIYIEQTKHHGINTKLLKSKCYVIFIRITKPFYYCFENYFWLFFLHDWSTTYWKPSCEVEIQFELPMHR